NIFSASGNDWRFENGFVNDGTISLNSTGGSTDLEFVGTQTLSGSGSIVMSDHFQNRILNDTAADTLTTNFTGLAFNQMFIGDSLWIEVTQADVPAPGVSEPGAMLVFAAGLGTLFVARRRRRTLH
ncbi:MAG: PEP-CTERM sorting domain-containing protein, partial [Alphaproteobacteria bacterium]